MKQAFRTTLSIAIGIAVVALVMGVVGGFGFLLEPHLQWIPSVAKLEHESWYNTALPAAPGFARSVYVGMISILFAAGVVAATLSAVGLLWLLGENVQQMWRRAVKNRQDAST